MKINFALMKIYILHLRKSIFCTYENLYIGLMKINFALMKFHYYDNGNKFCSNGNLSILQK